MLPTARRSRRRGWLSLAGSLLILAGLLPASAAPALAASTDLFISEYIEGSSNNKAIEIYNGTGATVNLATGGYNIQMHFNGNPSAGLAGAVEALEALGIDPQRRAETLSVEEFVGVARALST